MLSDQDTIGDIANDYKAYKKVWGKYGSPTIILYYSIFSTLGMSYIHI